MKSYVMISGATGGLGKAFAVECASRGWDVYLTDLRPEPLAVLSAALSNTYGVEARWCACDLTDTISRVALFDALHAELARFWALINVAGIDHEGLFCDQSRADPHYPPAEYRGHAGDDACAAGTTRCFDPLPCGEHRQSGGLLSDATQGDLRGL